MKALLNKIKFVVGISLQLIIIAAMLIVGWSMATTNVTLDKSVQVKGMVQLLGMKTIVSGRTGNINGFVIKLKGEEIGYWIYRSDANYQPFPNTIHVGSEVTIYHSHLPESNNYYTVYQLENEKGVLYSKDEYERKEKLAGKVLVIPGSIILLGIVIFQIRKRKKANVLYRS